MGNYWEMKIKRQMVPKTGKSFVFFFPNLGNFLESHREKNVTETRKFWEIIMEHIFFPSLGNKMDIFPKYGKLQENYCRCFSNYGKLMFLFFTIRVQFYSENFLFKLQKK